MSDDCTLRSAQVNELQRMLRFNKDTEEGTPIEWKVLIFDKKGHDIISSVLCTSDLFKCGVTLYLLLDAKRHAISDVPALYFVEPTEHNIERIGKDVAQGLYNSYSLNFTRPLTRDQLEDLAAKTLHSSVRISQVFEQHLQFVVLEPEIFSLELPDTYRLLSDPRSSEKDIESRVAEIASGLYCMLLTLRVVPVIRASRGNAAEMVAQALDEKLRSLLMNRKGDLPREMLERRVVLTLIDRNLDLVSMFSHSWTYQSLINDTCVLRRNEIKIPDTNQTYDIEYSDNFWRQNHSLPFPEVADNVDAFLNKYKEDASKASGPEELMAELNLGGSTGEGNSKSTTSSMLSAMTAVPELTQRKKAVDMHMNIATVLLKAIGDRGLAQLFEAEETASRQTPKAILELVNNPELGTPEDKLRLYLVYYITQQHKTDTKEFGAIESAIINLATQVSEGSTDNTVSDLSQKLANALKYVKRTKEVSRMSLASQANSNQHDSKGGVSPDLFSRFAGSLSDKLNQGAIVEGFGNIISGLKNFLPENKDLPVTRVVQQLLEPVQGGGSGSSGQSSGSQSKSQAGIAEDFLYFNPHESRGSHSRPPPKRSVYDEAIVFMVGGGNYSEYANVVSKFGNRVLYGSTDIPTPHHFVNECAELGSLM